MYMFMLNMDTGTDMDTSTNTDKDAVTDMVTDIDTDQDKDTNTWREHGQQNFAEVCTATTT
jgi:hypothetical protein